MQYVINQLGIEIEGEFSSKLQDYLSEEDGELKTDGSIDRCSNEGGDTAHQFHKVHDKTMDYQMREYTTIPMSGPALIKWLKNIKLDWENDFHWNHSCGFHVHVSFSHSKEPNNLAIPPEIRSLEFVKAFAEKVKKDFPDVWKLRSTSTFASPYANSESGWSDEDRDLRFILSPGTRYRAVNFSSYGRYRTLEFRFFPGCSWDDQIKYVQWLYQFLTEFLHSTHTVLHDINTIPMPRKRSVSEESIAIKDMVYDNPEISFDNLSNNNEDVILVPKRKKSKRYKENLILISNNNESCVS